MKYFTFLLFAFAVLVSCKSENTLRDNATTPITPNTTTTPTTPAAPATTPPATVNVAGGAHYVCTQPGCAGVGGAGAGSCEVCGNTLAHNQAFHNQTNPTTPAGQTNTNAGNNGLSPLFNTASDAGATPQTITPATPSTPEPAQNANGVWHYTCSNGCAGGAGSAIACSSCGSTLAHNSAYH